MIDLRSTTILVSLIGGIVLAGCATSTEEASPEVAGDPADDQLGSASSALKSGTCTSGDPSCLGLAYYSSNSAGTCAPQIYPAPAGSCQRLPAGTCAYESSLPCQGRPYYTRCWISPTMGYGKCRPIDSSSVTACGCRR